jgi:hypothetical protein
MGANCDIIMVIVPFHISIPSSLFAILSTLSIKIDAIFKLSSRNQAIKKKIMKNRVDPRFLMIIRD